LASRAIQFTIDVLTEDSNSLLCSNPRSQNYGGNTSANKEEKILGWEFAKGITWEGSGKLPISSATVGCEAFLWRGFTVPIGRHW